MTKKDNHHEQGAKPARKLVDNKPIYQSRKLVPGKVIYPPDIELQTEYILDPITYHKLEIIVDQLKDDLSIFDNNLTEGFILHYQQEFDKAYELIRQAELEVDFMLPDDTGLALFTFKRIVRQAGTDMLRRKLTKALKRVELYSDLPYKSKAGEKLTSRLSWLYDEAIHKSAGQYFPFINFAYDQPLTSITPYQKEQIDQTLKGARYSPEGSSKQYTIAAVETTEQFWTAALRTIQTRNEKPLSFRHGRKIMQAFIECKLFRRFKIGPRKWVIVVGFYQKGQTQNYNKRPLGTKRVCYRKLKKFTLFLS
jgi:hypothetical protein